MNYYIHIPFCKTKCPYCDFYSETKWSNSLFESYFYCLMKELESARNENIISSKNKAKTIYFGGGTPSLFPVKYIEKIIKQLQPSKNCEITIEVNPESGKELEYSKYKDVGINRISLGIQSSTPKILKNLGRIHTVKDSYLCVDKILKGGYQPDNLSFDFIIGNPDETEEDLQQNLDFIAKYQPSHISAYMLTIYENTSFAKMLIKKELKILSDDMQLDLYHFFQRKLNEQGYQRYELSNYAKNNYRSKHNTNIWSFQDYLGLGANAHSYYNHQRWFNSELLLYLKSYQRAHEELKPPKTKLTFQEYQSEYIMLSFRKAEGIDLLDFKKRFKEDFIAKYYSLIIKYQQAQLLQQTLINVKLTNKGFDLYNLVVSDFI